MKLLKLFMAAALFIAGQYIFAQDCPDEVSTDPRNPNNADRPELENTFFWFPHDGNDHSTFEIETPGGLYPAINNPFWNPTQSLPVGQLAELENSDFYPEDGWELLKVNFGNLNDGTERVIKTSMPYMVLYNRYTGTMRFLGMWPDQSNSWQIIRFQIGIPERKWTADNVSGQPIDATNLLSIQGDAIQPLDQETEETVYEVITEFPGTSNASFFFWFDLPVAYDPCICNNDVAITLQASVENQWDVTVKGALDARIIQQGVPSNGQSNLVFNRIIGAAGATATAIATGGAVVNTGAFTGLLDIFSERPGVSSVTQNHLEILGDVFEASGEIVDVYYDSDKLEWRNDVTGESLSNSDWNKLFSSIGSFLNAGYDFATPASLASKPRTSVIGTITASGTATLNSQTGDLVYLGVPGSNWTGNLDETIESTLNGLNPEYPIYNNPLGTFSLLKTPTLKIKSKGTRDIFSHWRPDPNPNESGSIAVFEKHEQFQVFFDAEQFLFAFNPAINIDLESSEILASIVVKEKGTEFYRRYYEPCGDLVNGSCYDNQVSTYLNELDWHYGKNFFQGIDSTERITKPVPISYLNELVGEFMTANENDSFDDYDYFIRFNINIVSNNIGRDGKNIQNTQIMTFPMNVEQTSSVQYNFFDLQNDQNTSLYDNALVLSNNQSHYNESYTNISNSISSNGILPASILSSSAIHLTTEAHIQPKIRLAIDYPFQGLYPQEEVSSSYISDFCQNNLIDNQYQANQFSPLAPEPFQSDRSFINQFAPKMLKNEKVRISPNPAKEFVTVKFSHTDVNMISLIDLAGRPIFQKSIAQNSRDTQIDVSGFSAGVYIIRIDCGGEILTEKLVVTK